MSGPIYIPDLLRRSERDQNHERNYLEEGCRLAFYVVLFIYFSFFISYYFLVRCFVTCSSTTFQTSRSSYKALLTLCILLF